MKVTYKHPLHGVEVKTPHTVLNNDGDLHLKNKHGATYQIINYKWLISIEEEE